jgi:hypothetical protein
VTAAVIICVAGGVVLAADSRSSICEDTTRGRRVLTTHDGAQKVVTWGRALGAVCVGAGSIGGLPLDGLLRKALTRTQALAGPEAACWTLSERFADDLRAPALPAHNAKPTFSVLVAGYGKTDRLPSCWRLECTNGVLAAPTKENARLVWAGDGAEPIARLVQGYGAQAAKALGQAGLDADQVRLALRRLADRCAWDPVHPELPMADAADLARGLIQTCVAVARFSPTTGTVGGRIVVRKLTAPA